MKSLKIKEFLVDFFFDIVGTGIFAIGLHVFTVPNKIAPGGVSGIATLINYLFSIPIGTTTMIMNIPILLIGLRYLGKDFILKTLKTLIIFTLMIDYAVVSLPTYTGDPLLATLFGGLMMGTGIAIVFVHGSTTGGADVIIKLLQLVFPHMQLGRLMLMIDFVVITTAAIVYQNIETALYGIIAIFSCSKMIDMIIYGSDVGRMVHVISDKNEEIATHVIAELARGATFLKGCGAFTKKEKNVLLIAIRRPQFPKLKKLILSIDPSAFIMVSEVGEIVGNGFEKRSKI